MPRIARCDLKTAFFHIIVQGINKEYILYKEDYMKEYKKLLFNNLNRFDIKIISYCIMNNHSHILIYTENIEEMSNYMKSVNTSYARYLVKNVKLLSNKNSNSIIILTNSNKEKIIEMNQKLKAYIEQNIFEVYNLNEKGHGIEHIKYVIRRSFEFAKQVPEINLEMVYVIAAYHDIGHHIDAKNHEIISGKILNEDNELKNFFTNEQIKIMKEAVEDHRSSLEGEPRSVYGKIVSSADRNTDVITTLKRCYSYNSKHFPDLNQKEVIEKCRLFLIDKFGNNGYARKKMYFKDNEYDKYLEDITNLAMDKDEFSKKIKDVNNVV